MHYLSDIVKQFHVFYEETHASIKYRVQNPYLLTYQEAWYLCASVLTWADSVIKEAVRILSMIPSKVTDVFIKQLKQKGNALRYKKDVLLKNSEMSWLNITIHEAYDEGVWANFTLKSLLENNFSKNTDGSKKLSVVEK